MKRVLSLFVVLSLCIFALGCPGGGEDAVEGTGETPIATGGAENNGPRPQFKEGIDSGRAEDGSDEDK